MSICLIFTVFASCANGQEDTGRVVSTDTLVVVIYDSVGNWRFKEVFDNPELFINHSTFGVWSLNDPPGTKHSPYVQPGHFVGYLKRVKGENRVFKERQDR